MKKQLLSLMTILSVLGACQKNEVASLSEDVTIHATIENEDATKTVMDENNNILWSENDQIVAFMKSSYGHKYQVKPSFVGKSFADFSMVSSGNSSDLSAGNEWDHNVVYYPYSEDIECLKSGSNYELEVNFPSEQVYVPDSFANGSMAMVAVSENNNITFKNVLGGIKLQLKGTQKVTSIKIEGKNNEKLSGPAVVTAYTDGTKPSITMASCSSSSVTLNCGTGVQLNESNATIFIISVPPVIFNNGFIVTVTDSESKTYIIETDKANNVLRSSLLVMPIIKLDPSHGEDTGYEEGEEQVVPVAFIALNFECLDLYIGDETQLVADVIPRDATDRNVIWNSEVPTVAGVSPNGLVTAISTGSTTISATAGGVTATCLVTVSAIKIANTNYVDEYGVDHGKGVSIGMSVWAPVNCGYHSNDYPMGKHYQWGRKYGQGYSDPLTIEEGGYSLLYAQSEDKTNVFFTGSASTNYDWAYPQNDKLWNAGTEDEPIKTEYDPCPSGWRVPTKTEAAELRKNKSSWDSKNKGYWYSGPQEYSADVSQIFLPAAGEITGTSGQKIYMGSSGLYWSSSPNNKYARFSVFEIDFPVLRYGFRASGFSVRCVQE